MNKMKKRTNWLVNISWKTSVVLKFLSTEFISVRVGVGVGVGISGSSSARTT